MQIKYVDEMSLKVVWIVEIQCQAGGL